MIALAGCHSSSGGTDYTPAPPPSQPSPPSSESPEPPPAISLPQDPLFQYQWHLNNTGQEVFEGNIAEGLSVNYFSTDKSNPTPTHPGDFHGTAMAGIIAAAINGKGGVGVAPKVKVAGL